jgi:type IV pilus assembly protein PilC
MKNKKAQNKEIIVFIRQLALVLDSDLPMHQGLALMASKVENLKMKEMILDLQDQLKSGENLSQAIINYEFYLSPFVTRMIILGEESGNLVYALNEVAETLEKESTMKEKIKSALTYPLILFLLMLGVMGLLIIKILPTFEEILSSIGGEMPGITLFLFNIGEGLSRYFLLILLFIGLIYLIYFFVNKQAKGKMFFHKLVYKLPFVKKVASAIMGYKISTNLHILIKSGVSPIIAFDMILPLIHNVFFKSLVEKGKENLKNGKNLSDVLSEFQIFPGIMMPLFSIAQETGHIEKMLSKISELMDEEAETQLNHITNIVEPLLMIFLSLLMGLILMAAVLPVIEILNGIG